MEKTFSKFRTLNVPCFYNERYRPNSLLISGILIHLIFLYSIFVIYFQTIIVQNPKSDYPNFYDSPADRLFLFSADGLRARSLFNLSDPKLSFRTDINTPFFRSIVNNKASWGLSHTRVPSESRPGHIAMIAGFYEDPSAIMKGWKENPVDFDSVLKRTKYSWCWGSPDILRIFSKGDDHIQTYAYSPQIQDFGNNQTTVLDHWVFNRVMEIFKVSKTDSDLENRLNERHVMFFLHLLGIDTAGHAYKPKSREYKKNIEEIDAGIEKVYELAEQFFDSDRTAYIITADHGMTDWGSHGSGDEDETVVPFIAWGAGFKSGIKIELAQADIAPLMSTLIGIPIPFNSVGMLPGEILDFTPQNLAKAYSKNAKQMLSQYFVKETQTRKKVFCDSWFVRYRYPFVEQLQRMEMFMTIQNFDKVVNISKEVIMKAIEGLEYYQNYFQPLLLFCVTMAMIGWIAELLIAISYQKLALMFGPNRSKSKTFPRHKQVTLARGSTTMNVSFILIFMAALYYVYARQLPLSFLLYFTLPILIWWDVFRYSKLWVRGIISFVEHLKSDVRILLTAVCFLFGIEVLVISFFYRPALSVHIIATAFYPWASENVLKLSKTTLVKWVLTTIVLSVFPLASIIGNEYDIGLIMFAGNFLAFFTFFKSLDIYRTLANKPRRRNFITVIGIQVLLIIIAIGNVFYITVSFNNNDGLPYVCQLTTWCVTVVAIVMPLFGTQNMLARLLHVAVALFVPFISLSISKEPIFLIALVSHLFQWLEIEHELYTEKKRKLISYSFETSQKLMYTLTDNLDRAVALNDLKRAYFFVLYIIVAFFGIGNIASINSFDPMCVRCYVTVFRPFLMTALIIFKTLIPFIIATAFFKAANEVAQAPSKRIFLFIMAIFNFMGLHFLFLVRNQGSWLEIGLTISNFVIIESISFFLIILYIVASFLTNYKLFKHYKCSKAE